LYTRNCRCCYPRPLLPARHKTNTPHRTDIEQEVNGLYSFDRKEKIDPGEVKKIFDNAAMVYYDAVAKA
jgi:hypothetical protein